MYDYIIVGAGSAGCVLASRLSEDRTVTVLLLEAGDQDRQTNIRVPAAFGKLFKTEVDWAYYTEQEPRLSNRRLYWPRARMLGGCSSMNAMIYIWGNRRDYDRWRELGCAGWEWSGVEPHFRKVDALVSPRRYTNPLSRAFVDGCVEVGIPRTDDFNGAEQDGAGLYAVTQRSGRRNSAADAYLRPAMSRPNLRVQTDAHATRVLFDKTRAVGVAYRQSGHDQEAPAAREVILAGGAVNSPQLLMLSGIGRADHLRSFDISVIADLPGVGENLQDHLSAPVAYDCTRPVFSVTYSVFSRSKLRAKAKYRNPVPTASKRKAEPAYQTESRQAMLFRSPEYIFQSSSRGVANAPNCSNQFARKRIIHL